MGKASVPKRGRTAKTRPLRSDSLPRGMPAIVLGKASKKAKLKQTMAKKGKAKLKSAKVKIKTKPVEAEDSDTASVASARVRRSIAPNDSSDNKGSKRQKTSKAPVERSESPATATRLSRSSSSSSLVVKTSEGKKVAKGNTDRGKAKSPTPVPLNKGVQKTTTKEISPTSKGPTAKKSSQTTRKEVENEPSISKKGMTSSLNSSPDTASSCNSQSLLEGSDRADINDDEHDEENYDDEGSFVGSNSEDLDTLTRDQVTSNETIVKSINADEDNQKSIPKLTKKNINELFPSDDSAGKRLRSGSPASQKSTRSLSLHRNSPKSSPASGLRYATRSDSAIRVLRNGKHSKLKQTTLFENMLSDSSKKKRVYSGMLKDEDKIEDSRSDFSDEQSSIFSESDSSSFIDAFTRLKNNDLEDKIDAEDIPGCISNDEEDMMERMTPQLSKPLQPSEPTQSVTEQNSSLGSNQESPLKSTEEPTGTQVVKQDEERNPILASSTGPALKEPLPVSSSQNIMTSATSNSISNVDSEDISEAKECESAASQAPKPNEILNNIQSDWDSDGEGNKEDVWIPKSPKDSRSAFDELVSDSAPPQSQEKGSSDEEKLSEMTGGFPSSDDKQDSVSSSPIPMDSSKCDPLDTSSQQPVNVTSQSVEQSDPANPQAKLPDPIILKTSDKNGFAESVDFVAKKNPRIDFELLRRRTKRSMSFNMDVPEKNQSQRILSVEPNKLSGKTALVWTVKAVREPIIPKSSKSPDKSKCDSQENRNVSSVKPMMESTQNDHLSTIPKVPQETVVSTVPFPVSSSSIKENILVQTAPKQNSGKSPAREAREATSATSSTPKPVIMSPTAKPNSDLKKDNVICKPSQTSADSALAATLKPSLGPSSPVHNSEMTLKAATVASPFSNILVSSASSVGLSNDVSVATAVQTPIGESMTENDPLAPCLASDQASKADEAAIDRCMTPNHQSTPHKSIEITPEKLSVDDGESFCLRLSPTPTKEEVCDHSTVTPVKEHLKADDKLIPTGVIDDKLLPTGVNEDKLLPTGVTEDKLSPTGVAEDTLLPAGVMQESCEPKPDEQKEKDNESLSDIRQELEEKLPVEIQEMGQTSVEEGHDNYEVLTKADTQTLQLVRRKGPSSGRPRSRSADFNPTSLAFGHEDIWIVKNDVHSIRLERRGSLGMARTLSEETSDGNFGETKENVPELSQSDKIDSDPRENNTETQAGTPSLKSDEKNDSSSSMTVECPDVRVKQPGLLSPRLEADVERLHLQLNDIEKKRREITEEEQSPEKKAIKEWILSSLGLQSVAAAAAAAASSSSGRPSKRRSQDGLAPSSGRLKAVIKIPKDNKRDKKSDRKPLRMVFKNGKPYPGGFEDALMGRNVEADSTVGLEGNSSDVSSSTPMLNESDHGANSSILLSDLPASLQGAEADGKGKPAANLIIPEKSSSFSIHPGRLCSDVCSYCFGKFGSLDTPCHVAQLKSRERQMKIMSVETHLAMDSCLCDACIRYVDRKANCPSSKPQTSHRKESKSKFEGSMANCSVTACVQPARHSLRKKWYIKIRKSVMKKCPIDLELAHQHLPLPLCPEHFSYMEYFMVCGLCKRRLSRSHMYNLTNTSEINICLEADGIPARLSDKLFVCKLCRYYATLRVKHPGSHFNLSSNQREFFNSYRKRILLSHDIDVSDIEEGNADLEIPNKITNQEDAGSGSGGTSLSISTTSATVAEENLPKGKRRRAGSNATNPVEAEIGEQPRKKSRSVEQSSKAKDKSETGKNVSRARSRDREGVPPITISVAEHMQPTHNKIHKVGKASKSRQESENTSAMEWAHKGLPPFYPGEDELALHGKLQFQFDDEPSANRAWEKCTSTLQFDKDTKKLWQELQRPYGSQSSFLRHLVLMERYWRQGELILAPDASAKATSYTRSVQNRLKAYGSTITMKSTPEPPKPTPSVLPSSLPQSVAPAVTEALTGGTVLTAAAAAAAVTAVHLSSSPAPLQSPSSSGSLKETIPALPPAKVPHPKQQAKPQGKSQQNKSHSLAQVKPQVKPQVKAQGKPQVVQRIQPMLQVASVAPHVVKSPSTMKVSVKTSLPNQEATSPLRQQLAAQVASSGALSVVSISTPMSVTAGVTITAEPNVKPTSQLSHGKLQQILPKPQSSVASKSSPSSSFTLSTRVNTSSWEPTTHTASSRSQFMPISAPVVNLTRSISLTAVPSSPPSVPDLHPINSDGVSITRPSRSPSASLAQNSTSMSVSSRGSSGGFVSIIPTSPNKTVYSKPPSQSLNKPASITPIYTSQSLPSSVTVTASSASTVSSPAVLSTESRAPTAGKVHVTAGGKSFSLTIQQFKKLQALRQQRQQEQQCKRLGAKPGKEKERRERETTITPIPPVNQRDDLEVVEVRDTDSEGQQISFPTISAVCSGDQAKAMWNDESRAPEGDSNTHLSVSPSMVDITQIVGSQPELPVENLPKIPKTLTVTQIRKESSTFTKTVSASGMSLTITRQKCQTPVQPQISSPVLDIFPS